MDTDKVKRQILTSGDFVISEVNKMRTLYGLKKEIRYDQKRTHEAHTESVAEHIYAMHCLIDYFLPLENPEGNWDVLKIHRMAQYHDIDEIETGDIISFKKTENEYEKEREAAEKVISGLPETLQPLIRNVLDEYEEQRTPEAKFVKALDKIESVFQLFDENGSEWLKSVKGTKKMHMDVKEKYLVDFPVIERVNKVMCDVFEERGFFYPES